MQGLIVPRLMCGGTKQGFSCASSASCVPVTAKAIVSAQTHAFDWKDAKFFCDGRGKFPALASTAKHSGLTFKTQWAEACVSITPISLDQLLSACKALLRCCVCLLPSVFWPVQHWPNVNVSDEAL